MGTKYVLNNVSDVVSEMLQGLALTDGNLALYPEQKIVLQRQVQKNQVHVVSGGGSGHEPFAAGFVGEGMLSGAVAGEIFTSPPAANIEAALAALCRDNEHGVLAIVANYTGDILNFGIACERLRSKGQRVRSVVVGEDCASADQSHTSLAGRRGMCGIVLVIKIAGAMAASGEDLEQVAAECQRVADSMGTLGVCLDACSIPGTGGMFTLAADEIDIGLGIHGEAGMYRTKISSAKKIIEILLDKTCRSIRLDLETPSSICIMVNNLGSLTQLEIGIIHKEIYDYFKDTGVSVVRLYSEDTGVSVVRLYSGVFMTSLNMRGFQLCVLKVEDVRWLDWLDANTEVARWPKAPSLHPAKPDTHQIFIDEMKSFTDVYEEQKTKWSAIRLEEKDRLLVGRCLRVAAERILGVTEELNELDQTCGDGDCGSTLSRLAQGVLQVVDQETYAGYPIALCFYLESWAQNKMGGTSGALYSLFFLSAGRSMLEGGAVDWVQAFTAGVDGMLTYSRARRGDRTMLDVLIECKESLQGPEMTDDTGRFLISLKNLNKLEENLRRACEDTKSMVPRAGRASNVDARLVDREDAGAYGAYLWISAVIAQLKTA